MKDSKVKKTYILNTKTVALLEGMARKEKRKFSTQLEVIVEDYAQRMEAKNL